MSRRFGRALTAVLVAVLVPVGLVGVGPALEAADQEAWEVLERARMAAREEHLAGTITVAWRDGDRAHQERVEVSSAEGRMRLGSGVAVGAGGHRLVRGTGGWLLLWRDEVAADLPPPAAKYTFATETGPAVAGRPTDVLVVGREGGQRARERLYLDQATGLLLRRELLDARGRIQRSTGFTRLGPLVGDEPTEPVGAIGREPEPLEEVPGPYRAPERIGDGFVRVGAYQHSEGLVQLYYSDGLHSLSVFEQPGRLTEPAGGSSPHRVEIGGRQVLAYSTAVGEAAVWEGEGIVYTVVGDTEFSEVAAAVDDLSHDGRPGRFRRVADVVTAVFRLR